MKPFEYYEEVEGVEYYSNSWEHNEVKLRTQMLDNVPLTVADRKKLIEEIVSNVAKEAKELNKAFIEAHEALKLEFWSDLRSDLQYVELFNDEGVKIFESWIRSEVFGYKKRFDYDSDYVPTRSEETYNMAKWLLDTYKKLRSFERYENR